MTLLRGAAMPTNDQVRAGDAEELMRIVTDPVAQRVLAEIAARMGITEAPPVHLN